MNDILFGQNPNCIIIASKNVSVGREFKHDSDSSSLFDKYIKNVKQIC